MPQIQLTPAQRKDHRSEAHHLDPVVMVGGDGLTANVEKEIDAALNAHGLIKVRVFSDDRVAREAMFLNPLPWPFTRFTSNPPPSSAIWRFQRPGSPSDCGMRSKLIVIRFAFA